MNLKMDTQDDDVFTPIWREFYNLELPLSYLSIKSRKQQFHNNLYSNEIQNYFAFYENKG